MPNNETKFKLEEATKEEKDVFMTKFQNFLEESNIYFEPVPQFTRDSLSDPWKVVCQVILQKKVFITKEEETQIKNENIPLEETN